jgi:hypothetical protein
MKISPDVGSVNNISKTNYLTFYFEVYVAKKVEKYLLKNN